MSKSELDSLALIRKMILKYCDVPAERVVPEATLVDLQVDSLSLADMVFELEDALGRSVVDPKQRPLTVADMQRLVQPYMAEIASKVNLG